MKAGTAFWRSRAWIDGLALISAFLLVSPTAWADSYDDLRTKYLEYLTGGTPPNPSDADVVASIAQIDELAETYWLAMDSSPSAGDPLWSDLPYLSSDILNLRNSFVRLQTMALAYKTAGGSYYQDTSLRDAVRAGLDFLYASYYNESIPVPENSNWFNWEVSIPTTLGDICVLMYSDLPTSQTSGVFDLADYEAVIDHVCPDPTKRTYDPLIEEVGANRVGKAFAVVLRGIVGKSSAKLEDGRDACSAVFPYVTGHLPAAPTSPDSTKNGFFADGTFIFHNLFPYNLAYGASQLSGLAKLIYVLDASAWEVTDAGLENVHDWFYRSFEPVIYRGYGLRMFQGRVMPDDSNAAVSVMRSMVTLLNTTQMSATDAIYITGTLKYWLSSYDDIAAEFYERTGSLQTILWAKAVLASGATSRGPVDQIWNFAVGDRLIKESDDYGIGLAMSSSRTGDYESINNENLKGWFTASGMTYYTNDETRHFFDGYFTTVDWSRLPGTTVLQGSKVQSVLAAASVPLKKDAYVQDGSSANTNFGGSSLLMIKKASVNNNRKSYVNFKFISGQSIADAKLKLYGHNSTVGTGYLLKVDGLTQSDPTLNPDGWLETGTGSITWNNPPSADGLFPLGGFTVATTSDQWHQIDATEFVWTKVGSNREPTFLVDSDPTQPSGADIVHFASLQDSNSALRPQLEITVNNKSNRNSANDWVGGATLAGKYGSVGMQFAQVNATLVGKKSWFLFEQEVVALGAGITSTDGISAETIIDNRKLNSSPLGGSTFTNFTLKIDGTSNTPTDGATTTHTASRIYLQGQHAGSGIGYVFPSSTQFKMLKTVATRNLYDDRIDGSDPLSPNVTNAHLAFWLDHGSSPSNSTYQYIVLPAATESELNSYASSPDVTILSNTTSIQAAYHGPLGLVGANFWNDSSASITAYGISNFLTSDKKAAVMLHKSSDVVTVAVSDPTMANTGSITLTLNISAQSAIFVDPSVTVSQLSPTVTMSVNVNGANGATHLARFALVSAPYTTEAPQEDSLIRDGSYASTNYGSDVRLQARNSTIVGSTHVSLLKFDTSGVATVGAAKLRVYAYTVDPFGSDPAMTANIYGVDDSLWDESTVTYNTAPLGRPFLLASQTMPENAAGYYEFDVTDFVRSKLGSSVSLELEGEGGFAQFRSKEYTTSPTNHPELLIWR